MPTIAVETLPPAGDAAGRLRRGLFLATGLAVPLYAFPPFRVLGRDVDLASALAAVFVLSCASLWARGRIPRPFGLFFLFAAVLPLLVWIPPRPETFTRGAFLVSYAHWLLVISFFASAASLSFTAASRRSLVLAHSGAALAVAAFALYQVVGVPKQWPGTGVFLIPLQREAFRFTRIGGTFFGGGYTRPTSIFLEPAWLGGYLAWVAACSFEALLRGSREFSGAARVVLGGAALFCSAAILATVSWGAYGDFAVVLAATFALTSPRDSRASRAAGVLLIAGLLCAVALSPVGRPVRAAIAERWGNLESTPLTGSDPNRAKDSSWVRVRNLRHTADLFAAHPLRGIGLGQFALHAERGGLSDASLRDPWCGWVAIGAAVGAGGPVLIAAALLLAVSAAVRGPSPAPIAIVLVLLAAFVQIHTGSYSDLWWWYPVSLAAVLSRQAPVFSPGSPASGG
ncbi:MAG: hypothetical protein ABJC07_09960 [Acidobacteriota bacterium]